MKEKDIRIQITEHLKSIKRSLRWLASEIDVNYNSFYYKITHPDSKFSKEIIAKINTALKTKFKD